MIVKQGSKWAVIHAHKKKKGSKTDKPKGSVIATHATKAEALAQHRAIMFAKRRKGG